MLSKKFWKKYPGFGTVHSLTRRLSWNKIGFLGICLIFWHIWMLMLVMFLIVMAFEVFTKHIKSCGISVYKENSSSALQQAIRRPIRPGPRPRLAGIHQDQPHTQTRVVFSDLQCFVLSVPFGRWMLMRHIFFYKAMKHSDHQIPR